MAHEPPLLNTLPDADRAVAAWEACSRPTRQPGWVPAWRHFIAFASHEGEFPRAMTIRPDPAMFGMPTEDDGSRDDPLLVRLQRGPRVQADINALRGASTRIVVGVGEETGQAR